MVLRLKLNEGFKAACKSLGYYLCSPRSYGCAQTPFFEFSAMYAISPRIEYSACTIIHPGIAVAMHEFVNWLFQNKRIISVVDTQQL